MIPVLCVCGELAIALVGHESLGSKEIPLCLAHYMDILELATARIEPDRERLIETVTSGGVL